MQPVTRQEHSSEKFWITCQKIIYFIFLTTAHYSEQWRNLESPGNAHTSDTDNSLRAWELAWHEGYIEANMGIYQRDYNSVSVTPPSSGSRASCQIIL